MDETTNIQKELILEKISATQDEQVIRLIYEILVRLTKE